MRLVGDIGGTNARFAIADSGRILGNARKLPIADHTSLVEAVEAYLPGLPPVDEGVLAVAGPVLGDHVAFTNSRWRFSIDDVRQRLGLRRLVVINDLVAQAMSFAALKADEIGAVKSGTRAPRQPSLVFSSPSRGNAGRHRQRGRTRHICPGGQRPGGDPVAPTGPIWPRVG